jgi:hypothetical protein
MPRDGSALSHLALRREGRRLPAVMRPALLRRRSIWLPTAWGWLLALVLVMALLAVALRHLYAFLAPDEPVGAEVLVVEGWLGPDELRVAIPLVRAGGYRQVVTTGGRIQEWSERLGASTYAELARQYLIEQGLESEQIVAVPAPDSAQDRTYLSAVMVREWALAQALPPRAIDVLSSGVHGRRTRRMYELALRDVAQIGIRSAEPFDYEIESWWQTSAGAKSVVTEGIAWIWSALMFHPPALGSQEEMWGDPEAVRRWHARQRRIPAEAPSEVAQ